jgi:hypothetical protein
MTDDWQWFLAGEGGRDRILRDEVEGLHARLSSASSQTHRLSSQLAALSGSLETRLNALSAAFDAYVELGDVREELAAYEEPAAVRRSVMEAIDALAGRRTATPVDPRGLDYWLPYAMNAVIALVEGRPDHAAGERARALSSEADTFIVAVCGALGHGPAVADLLPVVLINDNQLTEHQQRIWRAAATGVFGEPGDDLAAIWRPALEAEPVAGWAAWVEANTTSPAAGIAWLQALVTTGDTSVVGVEDAARVGRAATPLGQLPREASAAPPANELSPAAELRLVATELIGRGLPGEAPLLQRSRELRARIERPDRPPAGAAAASSGEEPTTVVGEVRRALTLPSTSPAVRARLVSWVAGPVAAVVKRLVITATRTPPPQESVRAAGAEILVTSRGVEPAELESGVARLRAFHHVPSTWLVRLGAAAGVALVITLVLAVVGSAWAWLLGVVAVGCGIGVGQQLQQRRVAQGEADTAVQQFREQIGEATARTAQDEEQRSATLVRLTGEAAALTAQLPSPIASPGASVGSPAQTGA